MISLENKVGLEMGEVMLIPSCVLIVFHITQQELTEMEILFFTFVLLTPILRLLK